MGVTYDSDIDKARKLIKQIGLELAEDPEFKPLIMYEPLELQGVDALGESRRPAPYENEGIVEFQQNQFGAEQRPWQ